ncbi:hypothetical protein CSB20_05375 [bacterium DOLZORAL124_64_63]|nr:MAG: hypothetical protein CSB20_05375 [bacterium DOLZORAL124_64_63]
MPTPRTTVLLLVTALLLAAFPAAAQNIVNNGPKPAQGLVKAQLKELWRLGGEDDDVFFGTIARVTQDAEGRFYILDGQLSEAHIFSPDGEFIITVGREGEGPGEMRQPSDMFLTPDGNINCLTGFPGKVISITPDNVAAGTTQLRKDGQPMPFGVLIRGLATSKGLLLGGIRMEFTSNGISNQNYFLAHCDREGNLLNTLAAKQHVIDYPQFTLSEKDMDFIWQRMDTDGNDRLYMAVDRDRYSYQVMDLEGNVEMIVNREFQAPKRTARQKKTAELIIDAVAKYHPRPLQDKTILKTEPAIGNLTVTRDGRVWIAPAVQDSQLPEGTWALLDVFGPDGVYQKQVALEGHFDRNRDAAMIMPDGKLIVVTGALDAFLNQMNAAAESADEVDPLEVICFELEI